MPGEFTPNEARQFYDRFGSKQDYQSFYEDRATTELLKHAQLESAKAVFEFGCGTGRFAGTLLSGYLSANTSYTGVDISPKMVELTRQRLERWSGQVQVQLMTDPAVPLLPADSSIDRFISNYVLDLLSPEYSDRLIQEAHRTLSEGGFTLPG